MSSLNHGILNELVLPIPPVPEQQRIMMTLRSMRREAQQLESIYQRKIASLDELKQSLLHEAFSGRL